MHYDEERERDTVKSSKIELHNVDCMEYMKTCKDNEFDLAIVDPPYGINVNVSMGRRAKDKKSSYHKFAGGDTDAPNKDYFIELQRVSKNQIIWGANHFIDRLPSPNSKSWIVWDKKFSNEVSFATAELAWTSIDKVIKTFSESSADKHRIHPTQKPVRLYEWILSMYAKPGQRILDTHLGSGSIAIACHYFGVDLVGCELDTDYFNAAKERIDQQTKQHDMF